LSKSLKDFNSAFKIDKRGQWLQLTLVIVILFGLGIAYLFLGTITEDLNTTIQAETGMSAQSKLVMQTHADSQGSVFDSSIAVVLAGVWLLCLALAYNAQGNPLLLVVALFIIVALGVVGMFLSNAWDEFSTDPGFSSAAGDYLITGFVLSNYLVFVLVMGFSTLMVGMSRGGGF
jgi:hypothetical protein